MFDSHCHLADEVFAKDGAEVMARAREAGLQGALCILDAHSEGECARAAGLSALWPGLRFSVGVHPHQAARHEGRPGDAVGSVADRLASLRQVCAIGEIGLDYHYDFAPRAVQREVFRAQLALARERDLPVVVHAREADADVLEDVRAEGSGVNTGVFHCFTGNLTLARGALDAGFHISIAGIVSFPKAANLREVARFVPEERLLVETDSPFLAPVPHRGKRNEPAWVVRVAQVVAEVRGVSLEAIAGVTSRNFERLFLSGPGLPRVDSPEGLC